MPLEVEYALTVANAVTEQMRNEFYRTHVGLICQSSTNYHILTDALDVGAPVMKRLRNTLKSTGTIERCSAAN